MARLLESRLAALAALAALVATSHDAFASAAARDAAVFYTAHARLGMVAPSGRL